MALASVVVFQLTCFDFAAPISYGEADKHRIEGNTSRRMPELQEAWYRARARRRRGTFQMRLGPRTQPC
jgi:hypothetical protein